MKYTVKLKVDVQGYETLIVKSVRSLDEAHVAIARDKADMMKFCSFDKFGYHYLICDRNRVVEAV